MTTRTLWTIGQISIFHNLILKVRFVRQLQLKYLATDTKARIVKVAQPLRRVKAKSSQNEVKPLVDLKVVELEGGNGGDGCISLLSDASTEFAGPDGGCGGHGGHIIFQACSNVRDLYGLKTIIKAESGGKGGKKDCHGKSAQHTVIKVPIGTVFKREHDGKVIGDLAEEGAMFVGAKGGAGGHGNGHFKSDTNQTPMIAEYGGKGESKRYIIELKCMADFGLLGLPNAGKSTLLQAISRARPKVASYPFTTLAPFLGIIHYDDHEQISVADLPGLIEDSHKNKGLGIQFLKHVERCAAILVMVDASDSKPWHQVDLLRNEMYHFSEDLRNRVQIIVVNKIDVPGAMENFEQMRAYFEEEEIIGISAKHGTNILELLTKMRIVYDTHLAVRKSEKQNKEENKFL